MGRLFGRSVYFIHNTEGRMLLVRRKHRLIILAITEGMRYVDREKSSGQTDLFNIWPIGAVKRTSAQSQVKLSFLRSSWACCAIILQESTPCFRRRVGTWAPWLLPTLYSWPRPRFTSSWPPSCRTSRHSGSMHGQSADLYSWPLPRFTSSWPPSCRTSRHSGTHGQSAD